MKQILSFIFKILKWYFYIVLILFVFVVGFVFFAGGFTSKIENPYKDIEKIENNVKEAKEVQEKTLKQLKELGYLNE